MNVFAIGSGQQTVITRKEGGSAGFEYVVNEMRCIGCGFCAKALPLRDLEYAGEYAHRVIIKSA